MSKVRTHAIRALEARGIPFRVVEQSHKAKNVEEASLERQVPTRQVVKTLLVQRAEPGSQACRLPSSRYAIALVRGDQRLSLKKLARLMGVKALEMAPQADVSRVTGYQIGAVSPLGLRRADVSIYVDQSILEEPRVSISAGRHDMGLELESRDIVQAVSGTVADIVE